MIKLSKKQLKEKEAFIKRYMREGNNATLSEVDSNANVSHKNVATLDGEINKDVAVQVNEYVLAQKIKEVFGNKYRKRFLRDLKNHIIYSHDSSALKSYCAAISLVPFIYGGASNLAGDSEAPKHLASFCGSYINLMYSLAGGFSGALADISMLTYFHYYAKKDFGEKYLVTNKQEIENFFQQIIYSLNSPAGARNHQSIFYNTSIFDRDYFNAMFGEANYPDGSKPEYDEVKELQKFFMNWFGEERHKALLTFPVITAAYITENGKAKDEEFNNFIAEEMAKGHSFFHYHSDNPSALSSCCFDGTQKVLTKSNNGVACTTFEEYYNSKHDDLKRNGTIFHNGSWVQGKCIALPNKQLYRVKTVNNKVILVTKDHINPTLRGDITTEELSENDYLLFNTNSIDTFPEANRGLSYEEGVLLGMYLGDGSMGRVQNEEYNINLSLNTDKFDQSKSILEKALSIIDPSTKLVVRALQNNTLPVVIHSKRVVGFIRDYIDGNYSNEKRLSLDVLTQEIPFRRGILDGYYLTDGGNSNRIYTTSVGLVEDIEILLTSLGLVSIIDTNDRTDEPVIIRGNVYKRNYPLNCIRWYDPKNKRTMKDIFIRKNNSIYFKIKSIEAVDNITDRVYCFEIKNTDEPYFTLPNGIITHNCRLKNEIEVNPFAYSLGGTGMMTGSMKVITLNMNRIIQDGIDLPEKVRDVHRYLIAFRMLMQEMEDARLLPAYDEGYISLDKQYVTVGINGMVEAAEFLGYEISPNDDYLGWVKTIFNTISTENKVSAKHYTELLGRNVMINTELVPAENLGVKFAKWDKKDGYVVPRDCYNSYLYKVEDDTLDFADKFTMHGGDVLQYLDGGSALHLNFNEIPNAGTWKKIMQKAIDAGSSYWTYNVKSTCCNKCGYIDMNTRNMCSKCGSADVDYATRIIGYLKKIKSFSEPRQREAGLRYYHKN